MTNRIAMVVHTPSSVEQEEIVYRNEQDFVCPPQKVRERQKCPWCPRVACRALSGVGECQSL